jgi:signal transduction histidine kinase
VSPATGTFSTYAAERNLVAARVCAVLAAVLMPAGFTLDWVTAPDHVIHFLVLRLVACVLASALLLLTYLPGAVRHTFVLGVGPVLVCAGSIELMILDLGGYTSPYYAGLNLCILGVGVIFTWRLREAVAACAMVVSLWVIPTLPHLRALEIGPFYNNLYFLLLTGVIAVASNESRFRQVRREFDARTEVARTSEQLSAALARVREADRLKNEFFANISHELRTPLTLILSPIEDRMARGMEPEDHSLFEVIRRNAHRLLRLIDDLLDLARIDAGHLRLSVAPLELRQLAEQIVESFRPAAEAKGLTLSLEPGPPTRDLHGDAHRLEIVLSNLLGNALKFTPAQGHITLRIEQDDSGARLSVQDDGPGIAPVDLQQIFDRFYQVEGSARRSQGGVGIGLALARELCELHGGRLEVHSEKGAGSTFAIVLPAGTAHVRPDLIERRKVALDTPARRRASDAAIAELTPAPQLAPSPEADEEPILLEGGRQPRIVVAEDNEDLREFLRGLLAASFEVHVAPDGEEALKLVRAQRPDLVVSDVMMPRMTGNELCAAIKGDPALRHTPLIMLTARSGTEAVLEGYASGADDFVAKPVHPRILLARVRAQLRLRALGLQLAQQGKLAVVGTLAAGIGHEVRNPVNAIVNGSRTLLDRAPEGSADRRLLEVILDAGRRVEAISSALLDHASPAEHDLQRPCDLRKGIDATLRLLAHRTADVAIHTEYETSRQVVGAAGELNQVFLNLIDNAVRSSARNVWIGVRDQGPRVQVSVEDDGPGVPPELTSRIFDPFFTTREPGEGTGLGLYLSRRIVNAYGGELRVGMRPGGGAAFVVDLPAENRP